MACRKKRGRRKNISGIVTDTAIFLCRDMTGRLGRCNTSVMAGRAIVGIYAQVVKGDARKARKVKDIVASRAIQVRRKMTAGFANADLTVVA